MCTGSCREPTLTSAAGSVASGNASSCCSSETCDSSEELELCSSSNTGETEDNVLSSPCPSLPNELLVSSVPASSTPALLTPSGENDSRETLLAALLLDAALPEISGCSMPSANTLGEIRLVAKRLTSRARAIIFRDLVVRSSSAPRDAGTQFGVCVYKIQLFYQIYSL